MRNAFLLMITTSILLSNCGKKDATCSYTDSSTVAPTSEVQTLQNYLSSNNITATAHPSGFFYSITAQGSGKAIVNLCSQVTINYVGKLTNGTVFDQTQPGAPATFTLGQLIVGWQKGMPLISKGGSIRLYIPPSLGYGSSQVGPIPPNSILIFDITMVDIN
ncbi:MAG: hypothetical protein NVSMB45_06870 [Ginsengibacter sp.]